MTRRPKDLLAKQSNLNAERKHPLKTSSGPFFMQFIMLYAIHNVCVCVFKLDETEQ